jgi:hypothetical protein
MLTNVEILGIVAICYVLPMIHVLRSDRTAPNVRAFWAIAILVFGLFGYLIWWMMSTPQARAGQLDSAALPVLPAADPAKATIYFVRWAFAGMLINNTVYLDDRNGTPVAQIRGRGCVPVSIAPGKHTLFVKTVKWFEFPFDAEAGQVLAFSLNLRPASPFESTLDGFLDDANARYQIGRLSRKAT